MKKKILDIVVLLVVGIINGLFSTGAGQILLFYYVYILRLETKEAREKTLSIMPIVSIPTLIFYISKSNIQMKYSFILIIISLVFGFIGNKLMNKMNGRILNIVSGVFLVLFSVISLWRMFI